MKCLCCFLRKMPPMFDAGALIHSRYKPDVIKGDKDSIRTEVLDFYTSLGTKIIDKSHDQDTTDLHKCVTYIRDFAPDFDKSNVGLTDMRYIFKLLLRAHTLDSSQLGCHQGVVQQLGLSGILITQMEFGGLVSTCNIVTGEKVTVQSDSDLLWTISLKKL
ncbi:hypothetical protein CRYUN_Cryun01aG0186500 [Craigia yunnanensis]